MSTDPSHMTGGAPILPTPPDEPRYTLAEAEALLAKRDCQRDGHEFVLVDTAGGLTVQINCTHCRSTWNLVESER